MGHTIVYDRLFIRAGDRFIPFCLYGSSNCTQISYKTGREILERSWDVFSYGDNMILGTADEIMEAVRKLHPGGRNENFVFHGKWLDDAQVLRFFENGIKNAVTIEEIRRQAHQSLVCNIEAYVRAPDADSFPAEEQWRHEEYKTLLVGYPKTSSELITWVQTAKEVKNRLMAEGEAKSAYINISCLSENAMKVLPAESVAEPCVLYTPKWGYLVSITDTSVSFTGKENWERALVFPNSEDAYLAADKNSQIGAVKPVPVRVLQQKSAKNRFVLSVDAGQRGRVYIEKKTPRYVFYTRLPERAKRFPTEAAAAKWFREKIEGKSPYVKDPVVVMLPSEK